MGRSADILVVLDQGTSATRAVAFDTGGRVVAFHTHTIHTHRPHSGQALRQSSGQAEIDPREVLASVDAVLERTLADVARDNRHPAALGLSVQRSSFLLFDSARGQPLTPILTWQDTRAADILPRFKDRADAIARTTGIPLGPYYGGPKFAHLLARQPALRAAVRAGRIAFIPLESLLIHHLTGRLLIDETIAGRTLVFDINRRRWSDELLALFNLPERALPELVPSRHAYGALRWQRQTIPLLVCLGDQQAAMTGLGAREQGELAINLGTSGSVALHTGGQPQPAPGLLTNVAFSTPDCAEYLLEGTINAVGALFTWFAEELGRPDLARRWPELVAESTDLILVPGVNGLAAPYWRPDVVTTYVPHREGLSMAEQLRAGMESIAFLVADIVQAMFPDSDRFDLGEVHVGGGMARTPLLQFMSNLLQQPLHLHRVREATARGVAIRLAQALGWNDFPSGSQRDTTFTPAISPAQRDAHRQRWHRALEYVLGE